VICSECGTEEPAMPTVYWPEEGDEAEEWPLCPDCHGEVAGEVLIVPGPAYCFGTCRECGGWFSVRDLSERTGGGRYSSPVGLCRGCSGEPA
jgi:hypothetical protein